MTTIKELFEMCQYAIENGHADVPITTRDTVTLQDIEFNDLVVIGNSAILTITPNNGLQPTSKTRRLKPIVRRRGNAA